MKTEKFYIGNIPVIVWGEWSEKVYLYVHGKMARKEEAAEFAEIAKSSGWQTVSFDLPAMEREKMRLTHVIYGMEFRTCVNWKAMFFLLGAESLCMRAA